MAKFWKKFRPRSPLSLSVDNSASAFSPELTDVQRRRRDAIQQSLLMMGIIVSILVVMGVLMVFSATSARSIRLVDLTGGEVALFSVAIKHTAWAVLGIVGALAVEHCGNVARIQKLSNVIFGFALLLQLAVILVGVEVAGNKNWLALGPIQIQPSEFLKFATIIWLARVLGEMNRSAISGDYHNLIRPVAGLGAAIGLVVLPGDMGTGIVFVLIGVGMFWLAGMQSRYLAYAMLLISGLAGVLVALKTSRLRRVFEYFSNLFTTPDIHEPTQSDFAQFAFGSGGWTGVGLGAGKEKWRDLSEAHTDFIFAVIGEELGLFGTLTIVLLFLMLGWCFLRLIVNQPSRFGQLLTVGAALWICGQAFLNMCVVTGLLPVFGIPLPFISQGGSSLLATLLMVGAVFACGFDVPGVRPQLKIRAKLALRERSVVKRG